MKTWKIVVVAVLGVLAASLAYPGIPAGSTLSSNMSTGQATLKCSYLHWTGLREKVIDMRDQIRNGGISMSNEPCYRWANWNPTGSS